MSTDPDKSPPSVKVAALVHFPAEVAEVALPDNEAVIVPAAKSPDPSLITNLLAVLVSVASANLVLSAALIIMPEPAFVIPLKEVTSIEENATSEPAVSLPC